MTTNASLNFRTTLPTTQDSPRELYEETLKRFNLGSEWKTVLDWYEIKEIVGAGSYGSVVKASCKFTGEIVAIKMVQNFTEHSYQLVKIIREIQIMKSLTKMTSTKMSFFPRLIDLIVPDNTNASNLKVLFFVMDHIDTDMSKVISMGKLSGMKQEHVKNLLYNLLCAINFMHTANIVHRDLKPSNILMNQHCQIRICDFGLARTVPQSVQVP